MQSILAILIKANVLPLRVGMRTFGRHMKRTAGRFRANSLRDLALIPPIAAGVGKGGDFRRNIPRSIKPTLHFSLKSEFTPEVGLTALAGDLTQLIDIMRHRKNGVIFDGSL